MVLETYEEVEKSNGPRDRRFRLEHGQIFPTEDLPRFAKLSVIVSTQPSGCCSDIGSNFNPQDKTRLIDGADAGKNRHGRSHLAAIGPVHWPPDPFVSIQEAVTRHVWRPAASTCGIPGGVLDGAGQAGAVETQEAYLPEEQLTVEQAVNAYTRGAAYAAFSDDRTGTLDPGKEGDLAVLSQDIFAAGHNEIGKTRVLMTMVGGKVVFNEMNDLRRLSRVFQISHTHAREIIIGSASFKPISCSPPGSAGHGPVRRSRRSKSN